MNTEQQELNAAWLKFAAIIEKHGKDNDVPEWRASKRTLPAMQSTPAPMPQCHHGDPS
jgi:hypothetical protein